MKQLLLPLLFIVFVPFSAFCQPAEFFYGSTGEDVIYRIIPSNDGNFLATGAFTVNQKKRVWLLKLSPLGDTIWQKTYTPNVANTKEEGYGLIQLADGHLLITGRQKTDNVFESGSALALKTDANGNLLWKQIYSSVTALFDAAPQENNFFLTGWKKINAAESISQSLLINTNGVLQWSKDIEIYQENIAHRIFNTPDGDFLITGRNATIGTGYAGIFIQKIKANGDLVWQTTQHTGWSESEPSFTVIQPMGAVLKSDGSIWVAQTVGNNATNFYLYHFGADGQLRSQHLYPGNGYKVIPYNLTELPNGNWLVSGEAAINGSNPTIKKGFASLISANGLEIWRNYYESGNTHQILYDAVPNGQNHFLMVGVSEKAPGNTGKDGWVLRTEQNGNHLPYTIKGKAVYDLNNNCMADANEPPAAGWFVNAQDNAAHQLVTDDQGQFLLNTAASQSTLTLKTPTNTSSWTICQPIQTVINSPSNPVAEPVFLVQATDGGCPKIEISVAQPDLQRCSTSNFVITVRNLGLEPSELLLLDLKMDPELSFISASENFVSQGATRQCLLPAIERLGVYNIDVSVQLACNVQLGATHTVVAQLHPPSCTPVISGPFYTVEGQCTGDFVQFMLQNTRTGGPFAQTIYRVISDDLVVSDWQEIVLAEGAAPTLLEFPADGRTWRVDVEQSPEYIAESAPSAVVEGCGIGANGLYRIGMKNSWPFNEKSPLVSAYQAPNTTGAPNKIAEALQGFGSYNMVNHVDWLEYTARCQVPAGMTAQEAQFSLTFSSTFDASSFQVIAGNGHVSYTLANNNNFKISLTGLDLQPGEYALVRFRIKPSNPVPGVGTGSYLVASGTAFINGIGPYVLNYGLNDYNTNFPLASNIYNNYPAEIINFGGRGYEYGSSMTLGADGSVFIGGTTNSYGYRGEEDGLLIKTVPSGQALWLNAIDLGDHQSNDIRGVAELPDEETLIIGNYLPEGLDGYRSDFFVYYAKMDANGHLLSHKKIYPAGENLRAWVDGMIPTQDGHFVLYGYSSGINATDDRTFYTKIDQQGNVIWTNYQALDELPYTGHWVASAPDGHLILLREIQSTTVNFDVYLQKLNLSTGAVMWSQGINSQRGITLGGLAIADNGNLLVAGHSQWQITAGTYSTTPTFIQFTPDGSFIEEKNPIVGPFKTAWCYNMINAPDGGYFVMGEIVADTTHYFHDALLLKIDANANVQWWKSYGASNHETAQTAIVSAPNQLLVGGISRSMPPLYDSQAFLIRTDLEGNLVVDAPQPPTLTPRIGIFPNPAVDRVWVRCEHLSDPLPWLLTDATGRIAQKGTFTNTLSALSLSHLPPGMYYLTFPDGRYRSEKIIVGK